MSGLCKLSQHLPLMHVTSAPGPSATGLADPTKMIRFVKGMLQLVGQRDTVFLFNNITRHLSQHNLLCSSRGVIVGEALAPSSSCAWPRICHRRPLMRAGTHPYVFPARADAWLFRQTAYDWAGLTRKGVPTHDNHSPRKIIVVPRRYAGFVNPAPPNFFEPLSFAFCRVNGRVFSNEADVIAAARSTGLEVEVVVDLAKLELKDVVRKLSGAGIIIAAHGGALVNTMFLPQVCITTTFHSINASA